MANLELLDPYGQDVPDFIDSVLNDTVNPFEKPKTIPWWFKCPKFNARGTHLATGCIDGRLVIWDFITRGVALTLKGHVDAVTSTSWAKNGRYVLTSSMDWNCIFWDLKYEAKEKTIRFASPVLFAQLHPLKLRTFAACVLEEFPVIVSFESGREVRMDLKTESVEDNKILLGSNILCFSVTGDIVFLGTAKGFIFIFNTTDGQFISKVKATGGSPIKNMHVSKQGRDLIINYERVIKTFSIKIDASTCQLDPQNQFRDLVEPIAWSSCGFSHNGDFVIAGSAQKHTHKIYVFDKNAPHIIQNLEEPKAEGIVDLEWHPYMPIIVSLSRYGAMFVWSVGNQDNWSAFTPGYQELHENIEYFEKETEFDWVQPKGRNEKIQMENEVVEVMRVDGEACLCEEGCECDQEQGYIATRPEPDVDIE
ncbi:chromatin binding protein [Nowakowskiella sp. JEL0407]|nr:chromatin binding protein [Nowakowskiella sp. JEL0407]